MHQYGELPGSGLVNVELGVEVEVAIVAPGGAWRETSLTFVTISGKFDNSEDSSVSPPKAPVPNKLTAFTPVETPGARTRTPGPDPRLGTKVFSPPLETFSFKLFSAASTAAIAEARRSRDPGPPLPESSPKIELHKNANRQSKCLNNMPANFQIQYLRFLTILTADSAILIGRFHIRLYNAINSHQFVFSILWI